MRSLLLTIFFFVLLSALDEVLDNPVALDGVLDERLSFIPLGHSRVFQCEAQELVSHLVNTPPEWFVIFYNPDTNKMERHRAKLINDTVNERFRQLADSTLLAAGIQRWHEGVVLECVIATSSATGANTEVISRHRLVVQDCGDEEKKNPCLYGVCTVHGFPDLFEAVRCNCSPQYTGHFCTEGVDDRVYRELAFFSPIIFMSLIIILLYMFSEKIENSGKCKPLKLERHLPKIRRNPEMKSLYPATHLSQEVINRVLQARSHEPEKDLKKESKETTSKEAKSSKEITKNSKETSKKIQRTFKE